MPTLSVFAKANIAGLEKKQQLIEAERVLLESLEWNALSATHLHFSHCYINKGVLCKDDTIDSKPASKQDLRVIHNYIEFLATLCLQGAPSPRPASRASPCLPRKIPTGQFTPTLSPPLWPSPPCMTFLLTAHGAHTLTAYSASLRI